jgi:excinuclease ABC subunit C
MDALGVIASRFAQDEREVGVKGLFRRETFTEFGPSALLGPAVLHTVRGKRPGRLRAGVRRECPRLPGVYGMVDGKGELVYVGKTKCLRGRLLSYFCHRSRDPKATRIICDTRKLVWEVAPDEFAALLRELELIRRWQPRHNVVGQPRRRRRYYVCVGRKPAPYVFLALRPPRTAFACFGPLPGMHRAREAVRRLNDWFRLRDCPQAQEMVFADQQELFPVLRTPGCLRHDIGNCLGPCAAACSQVDYGKHIDAALAFLQGKDKSPLEILQREMIAASAALAFERAASLRDRVDALRWLSKHLERMRHASRHSFIYPVTAHDGSLRWYLIHQGQVRAAVSAPHDEASRHAVAERIQATFHRAAPGAALPLDEVDGVMLVAGWFRRHPEERQRTLSPESVL